MAKRKAKKRKAAKRAPKKLVAIAPPRGVCLNLGAGDVEIPGYTPIDRKTGGEAFPLTGYADNSVDEVRASHILEHFGTRELVPVLDEWRRVLKPGGCLKLAVPNAMKIAGALVNHPKYDQDSAMLLATLMGGQTDENDFHRSAFTRDQLKMLFAAAGFEQVTPWKSEANDCASLPVSLNLCAYKPGVPIPKAQAIMSVPRLGFLDNIFCAVSAFSRYHIELTKFTGVFWGQCMTRGMQSALDNGVKYIFTLDYDTLFDKHDVARLVRLMETTDADAICGCQMKRDVDSPLFTMRDEAGELLEAVPGGTFDGELTQICSGHFGLTIIRAESLVKLPKPWFNSEPNDAGEWEDGRLDEDLWFWAEWKKAGLSLHQANYCSLGHIQMLATWPGMAFEPVYQYLPDFYSDGRPLGVR